MLESLVGNSVGKSCRELCSKVLQEIVLESLIGNSVGKSCRKLCWNVLLEIVLESLIGISVDIYESDGLISVLCFRISFQHSREIKCGVAFGCNVYLSLKL